MASRPVVNAFDAELDRGPEAPPGYRVRAMELGALLQAEMLGATISEIEVDQSIAPFHFNYGNEAWLLVLAGSPALRRADGEQVLTPGDVVALADGPAGAH